MIILIFHSIYEVTSFYLLANSDLVESFGIPSNFTNFPSTTKLLDGTLETCKSIQAGMTLVKPPYEVYRKPVVQIISDAGCSPLYGMLVAIQPKTCSSTSNCDIHICSPGIEEVIMENSSLQECPYYCSASLEPSLNLLVIKVQQTINICDVKIALMG